MKKLILLLLSFLPMALFGQEIPKDRYLVFNNGFFKSNTNISVFGPEHNGYGNNSVYYQLNAYTTNPYFVNPAIRWDSEKHFMETGIRNLGFSKTAFDIVDSNYYLSTFRLKTFNVGLYYQHSFKVYSLGKNILYCGIEPSLGYKTINNKNENRVANFTTKEISASINGVFKISRKLNEHNLIELTYILSPIMYSGHFVFDNMWLNSLEYFNGAFSFSPKSTFQFSLCIKI